MRKQILEAGRLEDAVCYDNIVDKIVAESLCNGLGCAQVTFTGSLHQWLHNPWCKGAEEQYLVGERLNECVQYFTLDVGIANWIYATIGWERQQNYEALKPTRESPQYCHMLVEMVFSTLPLPRPSHPFTPELEPTSEMPRSDLYLQGQLAQE